MPATLGWDRTRSQELETSRVKKIRVAAAALTIGMACSKHVLASQSILVLQHSPAFFYVLAPLRRRLLLLRILEGGVGCRRPRRPGAVLC